MEFDYIVALDAQNGIAKQGKLPWQGTAAGAEDMAHFKRMTMLGDPDCGGRPAVVMGRKTYESIPGKFRPLPGRVNVVISSTLTAQYGEGAAVAQSDDRSMLVYAATFEHALEWCRDAKNRGEVSRCWVIGGKQVYEHALKSVFLRGGYVTRFKQDYDCDLQLRIGGLNISAESVDNASNICTIIAEEAFATQISVQPQDKNIRIIRDTPHATYLLIDYTNGEERAYLQLLRELTTAQLRPSRTVPTRGLFHRTLRFSLTDERGLVLPLLTTKRVNWPFVIHEALWFMRGECDTTTYLEQHGVPIWRENSSREYLDRRGLDRYEEGQLGPVYGVQWRAWTGPNGKKYDQLARALHTIRTSPWDRQGMVVSAWNVAELDKMALPPCHLLFQFYVEYGDGAPARLNCSVYMRSADAALGLPFNIASYAFITHLMAKCAGLQPGELVITMADCHLYTNHIEGAERQLLRAPRRFPTFTFGPRFNECHAAELTLDEALLFAPDDYIVSGYEPHPFIKLAIN
jgi:dihydrofolate reductase/thymidylate synthase